MEELHQDMLKTFSKQDPLKKHRGSDVLDKDPLCQHYPDGMRVGLVFREMLGDVIVRVRQDLSISRASILFWRSPVSWCRASCKTLEKHQSLRPVDGSGHGLLKARHPSLTTAAEKPHRCAAAESAALSQSAPPPSVAAPAQGR